MMERQIVLLHVEDDNIDRMVVQKVLKKIASIGAIHQAQNGAEAMDFLRGENGKEILNPFPHLILLDINMPKMNGLEFLEELRSDDQLKHLPVFILTTSNDDNDKKLAYSFNVAGYIIKPLDLTKYDSSFQTLSDYWKLCEWL